MYRVDYIMRDGMSIFTRWFCTEQEARRYIITLGHLRVHAFVAYSRDGSRMKVETP